MEDPVKMKDNHPSQTIVKTPVVDFHFHVTLAQEYSSWFLEWLKPYMKSDPKQVINRVLESPKSLLNYMDEQGVDYTVCLAETNPLTTGTSPNERVAQFCSHSDRLIPFANINPYISTDLAREVEHCLELGFKGIKLYPSYQYFYPNDSRLYPLYSKAQELKLPVVFHTGSASFPGARIKYADPLFLDDVAVDFPKLPIIMAHAGRGFWYDRAFFLARLHTNLYIDVTGLPPKKLPTLFPDLNKIEDKVLFGSDWPAVTQIAANISAIRDLPYSEETKQKILGLNAARLLNIALDPK